MPLAAVARAAPAALTAPPPRLLRAIPVAHQPRHAQGPFHSQPHSHTHSLLTDRATAVPPLRRARERTRAWRAPPGTPREYNSYCGAWRLAGAVLTTTVDAALPALMGTLQVRQVKWEGARLLLSPPPLQRGGQAIARELLWERVG